MSQDYYPPQPGYGPPDYEQQPQYGQPPYGPPQYGQPPYPAQPQYPTQPSGYPPPYQAPAPQYPAPYYPPPQYEPDPYGPPTTGRGGTTYGTPPGRMRQPEPDYDYDYDDDFDDDDEPGTSRRTFIVRFIILALVLVAIIAALLFVPGSPLANTSAQVKPTVGGTPSASGSNSPSPSKALTPLPLRSAKVTVPSDVVFLGWALADQRSGQIVGNDSYDKVNTTASMIKTWIAADYLRRQDEAGATPTASQLNEVSTMIRDSNNAAADDLYEKNGKAASIERLISMCGLTDSKSGSRWSITEVSPRDAARLGLCIANGTAAGKTWTEWLLAEMRNVRGEGNYGIRNAFPATQRKNIAIKNGWYPRETSAAGWPEDGNWHMNCLAIGDTWVLAVEMRFPTANTFDHGKAICQSVAEQLLSAA